MASSHPAAGLGLGLGLACLLAAAVALPSAPVCPPHKSPPPSPSPSPSPGPDGELTPLCETVKEERTGKHLLASVTCPSKGCRCHRNKPEMRCVPFNTTVTWQKDGVETKENVTVACVCAIPG